MVMTSNSDRSVQSHESVPHYFLRLNNVPLDGYATFCLSGYQLMDIQAAMNIHSCVSFCVHLCFQFSWVNTRSGIAGLKGGLKLRLGICLKGNIWCRERETEEGSVCVINFLLLVTP